MDTDATKPSLSAAEADSPPVRSPHPAGPRAETPQDRAARREAQRIDLDSPEWYLNRELTWLEFNCRVLHEAQDPRTPLLERVKFLAIVSANLDEFFMKRIGGLMQQVGAGVTQLSVDGRTPERQIDECHAVVVELEEQQRALAVELHAALKQQEIFVRGYKNLSEQQREQVGKEYIENIFPLITPLSIDPAHPFPFISNLSLNLLLTVRYPEQAKTGLVRVKVPVGAGVQRFLQVGKDHLFVPLEDVIANNLDLLLPGMIIESCELFRVTRNAIAEPAEEQANDLLVMIESELRDRKFAPIVRLEVSKEMDAACRGMLASELGLNEEADVFEVDGLMGKVDLWQLAGINRGDLHDPPHHPVDHPAMSKAINMFHLIRDQGPILVQHPYESFLTSTERFVREASRDPKVLAIKMTIYRTGEQSKIIEYLIEAARNGKQVAVCVELKARFDESANIRWANYLEEAGIHVTYGVIGLKTHSKLVFVLRRDFDGLRRYAHIGTGNYHAQTARIYSDLGMFTCDPVIGEDLTELFNYLTTGHVLKRKYRKILPAPKVLKRALLDKIEREIDRNRKHGDGLIQFKMNALEDRDVTRALYQASQAGVKVDLIVRDTCRLRPGIPGLSETVRVVSIVGRFLEHARIYYFRNGGQEEYYIGSADCMKRNLESRVEVVAPVEAPELQARLREIIDAQLGDQRSAWDMQPDGTYVQCVPQQEDALSSQAMLIKLAKKRAKAARAHKKTKAGKLQRAP